MAIQHVHWPTPGSIIHIDYDVKWGFLELSSVQPAQLYAAALIIFNMLLYSLDHPSLSSWLAPSTNKIAESRNQAGRLPIQENPVRREAKRAEHYILAQKVSNMWCQSPARQAAGSEDSDLSWDLGESALAILINLACGFSLPAQTEAERLFKSILEMSVSCTRSLLLPSTWFSFWPSVHEEGAKASVSCRRKFRDKRSGETWRPGRWIYAGMMSVDAKGHKLWREWSCPPPPTPKKFYKYLTVYRTEPDNEQH